MLKAYCQLSELQRDAALGARIGRDGDSHGQFPNPHCDRHGG
jgi:hypothetical protein